ncbi:hypothetical protein CSUI_009675 [Cystoisospora suis]|uniref:Uncharacterized protein n=1 Tax=Cystoisospora suis TaxID=483139 RepID=A0A2C6KHA7_9APIC|nr:hypothetical protein CSUI_009675 [Cystoisospora suis]
MVLSFSRFFPSPCFSSVTDTGLTQLPPVTRTHELRIFLQWLLLYCSRRCGPKEPALLGSFAAAVDAWCLVPHGHSLSFQKKGTL